MAHRPIQQKQINRLRKALRRTPPAYFDLISWLKDHKHAGTSKDARELILAEKVKADSHPIGVYKTPILTQDGNEIKMNHANAVARHVPVGLRDRIIVSQ